MSAITRAIRAIPAWLPGKMRLSRRLLGGMSGQVTDTTAGAYATKCPMRVSRSRFI